MKPFITAVGAGLFFLATAAAGFAEGSWGDAQPNAVRESASTALFNPARWAFDDNNNTAWRLAPGSLSGWAERSWDQPRRLSGVTVSAVLPAGTTLRFSLLGARGWEPLPGSISGPLNDRVTLAFGRELPLTSKLLVVLSGTDADQAQVAEVIPTTSQAAAPFGKILPQSYSINQNEYINLKASRLWDGIVDAAWFSPLWSFPTEAFVTGSADQPTKIFPPYFGNPPQDAQIVWQLNGSYAVQTVKAYFIQNYQSVGFEFWDGTKWTNPQIFGAGWGDPGSGWKRIDLKDPVITTKIRVTFPGSWNRAAAIGELEVWGRGETSAGETLVSPAAAADGSRQWTINTAVVQDKLLEVAVAGQTAAPLTGEWNATPFSASPSRWTGGDTVYRIVLAKESLRPDTQFLKVNAAPVSAVLRGGVGLGRVDLSVPFSANPPAVTSKTWTFSVPYQLEKLRVYSSAPTLGSFQTVWKGTSTSVAWVSQGNGVWEANLGGISADSLRFSSPSAVVLDEVQLWGSPLADTRVGLEVWWPAGPVTTPLPDGNSLIGWMGNPSVQPLIGIYHPRQADKVFWMPLAQMGLAPGQTSSVVVQGTLGAASASQTVWLDWSGSNPAATLDQGVSLASVNQATFVVSGTVKPNSRVFVQGAEVPVAGNRYVAAVAVKEGFQLLDVQVWDQQKKQRLAQWSKPVYRAVGQPIVQFGLPWGDLWTQSSTLSVSGLVGNGLGLTLSVNGTPIALTADGWNQTFPLIEGNQPLTFVLKDNLGRETRRTLTVNKVGVLPTVQILTPLNGSFLPSSNVALRFKGSDPQYWWQSNSGPWTPAYTQEVVTQKSLADGYYTDTVAMQDRAGNVSAPVAVSYCVDTTPPLGFIIQSNVARWTNNNQPTVSFATGDATSGVDHYEYAVDGGAFTNAVSPLVLPVLADGPHTVFIKAVDRALNSTLSSLEIGVDTVIPEASQKLSAIPGASDVSLSWVAVPEPGVLATLPLTFEVSRDPAWPDGVRTVTTTSFHDEGLTSGSRYQYRVTAINVAGNRGIATAWVSAQVGVASQPVAASGPTTVRFGPTSLEVPEGAASADVISVQISQLPLEYLNDLPPDPLVSDIYQLRVVRSNGGTSTIVDHADFSQPVSVQLSYDPALIPAGMNDSDLKPFYYDSLWGRWLPVQGALVDTANHKVVFKTNHFTDFSIQATKNVQVSVQQWRDAAVSPLTTPMVHQPVSISPQGGVVSTAFTELSLPGKNGLNLVVRRVYDSGRAQGDANGLDAGKDGSYPWSLGAGWRLAFPFLKWNGSGLWVTDFDGQSFSLGQAQFVSSTGGDGQTHVVTYVNHEGSDATLRVTLQPTAHYHYFIFPSWFPSVTYTYGFAGANLIGKDGREVVFDAKGRVTQVSDSTHQNSIVFQYDGGNKATQIIDTMGRTVQIGYPANDSRIASLNVTAAGETYTRGVHYQYSGSNLASAVDVGGRTWTYGYSSQRLKTTTHIVSPSGYLDPSPKVVDVPVLISAAGPGIGVSTVRYEIRDGSFSSSQFDVAQNKTISFSITQGMLLGTGVAVASGAGPVRNQIVSYGLTSGGDNQFYVSSATVNDGRSITANAYSSITLPRASLSNAPEALQQSLGYDVGTRPDTNEVRNYLVSSKLATLNQPADAVETQLWSWDWDLTEPGVSKRGLLLKDKTVRGTSGDNEREAQYQYDAWGNLIAKVTTSRTPGTPVRQTWLKDEYRYYNGGIADLTLGEAWAQNPAAPVLDSERHDQLATQVRTIGRRAPGQSGLPETTKEKTQFLYYSKGEASPEGALKTRQQWLGDSWATTQYAYNAKSEITSVTGPLAGQQTEYTYSYGTDAPTNPQYTVTVTQKSVALGDGTPHDLVSSSTYRTLDGTQLRSEDAAQNVTVRSYDDLGRLTKIVEPAVAVGVPVTTMTYNDATDHLSSTVVSPLGLTTTYSFDNLGRLVEITKLKAADAQGAETIKTTLAYDEWDEVVSLSGPKSSAETTDRTTTFTYDFRGRVTGIRAPGAANFKTSRYDDALNQVTTIDELGNVSRQTLDWNGKAIEQTIYPRADQALTSLAHYDGVGRVVFTIDPASQQTDHRYNAQGLEDQVVAPLRTVWEGSETQVRPEIQKSYDAAGNLVQTKEPLANGLFRQTTITVNALGQVLTSSTPVSGTVLTSSRSYDAQGNLVAQSTGELNGPQTTKMWTYDSHQRPLTATDENGATVRYSYDLEGHRTSIVDPREGLYAGSFRLDLGYSQLGRLVEAQLPTADSVRPKLQFVYDGAGNLVKRVEADGQLTQYTYSPRNQLLTQTVGPYTTTQTWDDAGREVSVHLPGQLETSQQYDGASRVIEVNENGAMVAQYAYDANGKKVTVTDGNKHVTKYSYDPEGRVLTSTDAHEQISTVRYDRSGNPTLTKDPEGNLQSSSYDELGRLVSETNAWGKTQSISYDAWSNPTHRVDAQGTQWQLTYDPTGQILSETGTRGGQSFQRSYTYDEAGDRKSATDNGITTTYNTIGGTYQPDPYGLLRSKSLSIENTLLTMGYQYDQRQRLTSVTYPDASSVSYQYNQTNQIVGMPGWLTGSIGYNEAALLSDYTAANGLTTKITYDDRNRISTLGYSSSGIDLKNYQLTYDKAGNIVTKNQNIYGYDELNRLIGANERGSFQQEPQDVTPKVSALDSDYEPEVGVLDFTASYQAQDLVKLDLGSRSLGLDLGHEYGINQLRITPAAGQTIHRVREKDLSVWASVDNQQFTKVTGWKFTQDNGVMLIRLASTIQAQYLKINTIWDDRDIDDGIIDAATVSNQSSAIVQVWTQVTSQSSSYQYDATGNRTSLSVTRDGSTKTNGSVYYHNSTGGNLAWLASDGAWYYQYDDNGNLVTKARQATIDLNSRSFVLDTTKEYWNYEWDLQNRLTSVTKNSALVVSYRYDADNLRVSRTKDNQTKVYTYGRGGAIAYVKDITANTSRTYTYLDITPIGWTDTLADGSASRYYAISDHLGSVTQVTDEHAKVVWSSEYDPFGKASGVEGLYYFDGSYAGHEVDADTGLIYMWNRWQDPETGRFVSEDPARDGGNWYNYANNSPLVFTDPTGLAPWSNGYYDGKYDPNHKDTYGPQNKSRSSSNGKTTRTRFVENFDSMGRVQFGKITEEVPMAPESPVPSDPVTGGDAGQKSTPVALDLGTQMNIEVVKGVIRASKNISYLLDQLTYMPPPGLPKTEGERYADAGWNIVSTLALFSGGPKLPPTAGAVVMAQPSMRVWSWTLLLSGPDKINQTFNLSVGSQPEGDASKVKFTKEMNSRAEPIATGRGIEKVFELIEKFGGQVKGWRKMKTWDDLGREIHYYYHQGIGRVGIKFAGEHDPF